MTRRYLVVDDNPEFAENVAEILSDTGASVRVAARPEDALAQLRETRFDGVVTDMRMPGLSGAQLLRAARELDPGVPVVLVSAWSSDVEVLEARRLGLLAFIPKAGGAPRLVELLERARRDALVLLLEDDQALVENLTEVLGLQGFTVCALSTVGELEALPIRPFAALVDLRLPGAEDGESLRRVQRRFPDLPVLVVTALTDVPAGPAVTVFRKPFDPSRLVDALVALRQGAGAR